MKEGFVLFLAVLSLLSLAACARKTSEVYLEHTSKSDTVCRIAWQNVIAQLEEIETNQKYSVGSAAISRLGAVDDSIISKVSGARRLSQGHD